MTKTTQPTGDLAIKTLAMPAHTNANGDIFGGWLVSQMDLAGGIIAKQRTCSRVTTVAIDKMIFLKPVHVGNAVCCYGHITRVGRTSLTIKVEAWTIDLNSNIAQAVTEGIFTYVAIDDNGKPQAVKQAGKSA